MAKNIRSKAEEPPKGRFRRFFGKAVKYGFILSILLVIGVATAVGIAASSLPSFEEMRRSPNGQTIRVRDANGGIIVSLGPNYGPLAEFGRNAASDAGRHGGSGRPALSLSFWHRSGGDGPFGKTGL